MGWELVIGEMAIVYEESVVGVAAAEGEAAGRSAATIGCMGESTEKLVVAAGCACAVEVGTSMASEGAITAVGEP